MAPRQKIGDLPEVRCVFTSNDEMEEIRMEISPILIENPRNAFVQDHVAGSSIRMLVLENDEQTLLTFYDIPDGNCTVQDLIDLANLNSTPTSKLTVSQVTDPQTGINYIVEIKEIETESPESPENPYNSDSQEEQSSALLENKSSEQERESPESPKTPQLNSLQIRDSPLSPENMYDQGLMPNVSQNSRIISLQPSETSNGECSASRSPKSKSSTPKLLSHEENFETDSPLSPMNPFDRGHSPVGDQECIILSMPSLGIIFDEETSQNGECSTSRSPDYKPSSPRLPTHEEIFARDSPLSPVNIYDRGQAVGSLNCEYSASRRSPNNEPSTSRVHIEEETFERDSPLSPVNFYDRGEESLVTVKLPVFPIRPNFDDGYDETMRIDSQDNNRYDSPASPENPFDKGL